MNVTLSGVKPESAMDSRYTPPPDAEEVQEVKVVEERMKGLDVMEVFTTPM